MDYVFHASKVQGIRQLTPRYSLLLDRHIIYASLNFYIASLFLDKHGGDYICSIQVHHSSPYPFLIERVKSGIEKRFLAQSGAIYVLEKAGFEAADHLWKGEVISTQPVLPFEEIRIDNILDYIRSLIDMKKINFVPFDNRHPYIDPNDADLVQLFKNEITKRPDDPSLLSLIRHHHPQIYDRFQQTHPFF